MSSCSKCQKSQMYSPGLVRDKNLCSECQRFVISNCWECDSELKKFKVKAGEVSFCFKCVGKFDEARFNQEFFYGCNRAEVPRNREIFSDFSECYSCNILGIVYYTCNVHKICCDCICKYFNIISRPEIFTNDEILDCIDCVKSAAFMCRQCLKIIDQDKRFYYVGCNIHFYCEKCLNSESKLFECPNCKLNPRNIDKSNLYLNYIYEKNLNSNATLHGDHSIKYELFLENPIKKQIECYECKLILLNIYSFHLFPVSKTPQSYQGESEVSKNTPLNNPDKELYAVNHPHPSCLSDYSIIIKQSSQDEIPTTKDIHSDYLIQKKSLNKSRGSESSIKSMKPNTNQILKTLNKRAKPQTSETNYCNKKQEILNPETPHIKNEIYNLEGGEVPQEYGEKEIYYNLEKIADAITENSSIGKSITHYHEEEKKTEMIPVYDSLEKALLEYQDIPCRFSENLPRSNNSINIFTIRICESHPINNQLLPLKCGHEVCETGILIKFKKDFAKFCVLILKKDTETLKNTQYSISCPAENCKSKYIFPFQKFEAEAKKIMTDYRIDYYYYGIFAKAFNGFPNWLRQLNLDNN